MITEFCLNIKASFMSLESSMDMSNGQDENPRDQPASKCSWKNL